VLGFYPAKVVRVARSGDGDAERRSGTTRSREIPITETRHVAHIAHPSVDSGRQVTPAGTTLATTQGVTVRATQPDTVLPLPRASARAGPWEDL